MSILLLALCIASLVALATAANLCLRHKFFPAGRLAVRWAFCAVAYAAILAVSALWPHTAILRTGVLYCDDDVCMSVDRVSATPEPGGTSYRFCMHLSSLANHGPRSTKGATVYLTDARNRRFPASQDPGGIPFGTALNPRQSVNTSLTFHVPSDVRALSLAAYTDRIQYASFIIGSGDLFGKPSLQLRLP